MAHLIDWQLALAVILPVVPFVPCVPNGLAKDSYVMYLWKREFKSVTLPATGTHHEHWRLAFASR
jgi:hypothetical protein